MPVYEYKCVECNERFEVEQSMNDATLKTIKGEDHTHKVKKVFSPVGISFKGSGFYKNDSAKSKKKDRPKDTSSSGVKNGSGTSSDSSAPSSSTSSSSDAKAATT
ncbi:MAG: FmdB family transcriptional regulator [Acidimicrobiales bacterium]|nr:FmdB family transcriptional regulator [Acidimicrobiales bacterium]